jgi:hypothetical protein
MKWLLLSTILIYANSSTAQFKNIFPKSSITIQYAGSTGFLTYGFSKVSKKEKTEIGLYYGNVPRRYGVVNRSLTLKFIYNPFRLKIYNKFLFEPIQTGFFFTQNFGENHSLNWGNQYTKGYYWWGKSFRIHYFFSTQLSYKIEKKWMDKVAWYLEANTNDLYLYSYLPNRSFIHVYDIFFLGTGLKIYLK